MKTVCLWPSVCTLLAGSLRRVVSHREVRYVKSMLDFEIRMECQQSAQSERGEF